ncbi:hypothetical protein IMZ48_28595 [Candidatus Bathyarchaeota archaeon]|nr:hypothetical protein [Candidatus Bathyarchaeota archaeon]
MWHSRRCRDRGSLILCVVGRSRDGLYEPVLADIEREAVADLLQYLENVRRTPRALGYDDVNVG